MPSPIRAISVSGSTSPHLPSRSRMALSIALRWWSANSVGITLPFRSSAAYREATRQYRDPPPLAPLRRCHGGGRHSADGPSHRLDHLTFTPPVIIIFVAKNSFRPRLTGRDHEGTGGR